MMTSLAYEIGAVFLLAAMCMYGMIVKGFIPDILRNAKLVVSGLAIAGIGFTAYWSWPETTPEARPRPAPALPAPSTPPPPNSRSVPPPPPPTRAGTSVRRQAPKPAAPPARVTVVVPEPSTNTAPAPAPVTAIAEAPPAASTAVPPEIVVHPDPPKPNAAKRAVRSVGRFLHLGHEKYQPPAVVAQPASPPASQP